MLGRRAKGPMVLILKFACSRTCICQELFGPYSPRPHGGLGLGFRVCWGYIGIMEGKLETIMTLSTFYQTKVVSYITWQSLVRTFVLLAVGCQCRHKPVVCER